MPKTMMQQTVKGEVKASKVPAGLVELYTALGNEFGASAVKNADSMISAEAGTTTLELYVPPERVAEAMNFASKLSLQIQDDYDEIYSVVVVPTK